MLVLLLPVSHLASNYSIYLAFLFPPFAKLTCRRISSRADRGHVTLNRLERSILEKAFRGELYRVRRRFLSALLNEVPAAASGAPGRARRRSACPIRKSLFAPAAPGGTRRALRVRTGRSGSTPRRSGEVGRSRIAAGRSRGRR